MKIFLLKSPMLPHRWASFGITSEWEIEDRCTRCGLSSKQRQMPLRLYWEKGAHQIGDFSWSLFDYEFLATSRLQVHAQLRGWPCQFAPVQFVKPPRNDHPEPRAPRIAHPYEGPTLCWCNIEEFVPLDLKRSGLASSWCKACGRKDVEFRRTGLVVSATAWSGKSVFKLFRDSSALFMTESERDALEAAALTNWTYSEAGEIR